MKIPNNFWTYTKVILIVIVFVMEFIGEPAPIDSGDSTLPLWLAVIPVVFLVLFLPLFLSTPESSKQYIDKSPWPAFPISLFRDPLPFWHFCGWSSLIWAVPLTYHAFTPYNHEQLFLALFTWSCGIGALLGVEGAKRRLKRDLQNSDRNK
jgi:hypothetical protein